jgi:hypothetical protein
VSGACTTGGRAPAVGAGANALLVALAVPPAVVAGAAALVVGGATVTAVRRYGFAALFTSMSADAVYVGRAL